MRRLFLLVLIAALGVSACASAGGEPTSTTSDQGATTTSADPSTASTEANTTIPTTDEGASTTTSSVPDVTATTSGRPAAPDFTLELGGGGTYTLSDGANPVYLVFWAEW